MKFNIEVDIDWLGEDGSLDEQLKDEVINQIISRITASSLAGVEKSVNALISSKVEAAVGAKLNECLMDFLNRPRIITDKWGDEVKTDVTVMAMLKNACDKFLDEKVDSSGKISNASYQTMTRMEWLIKQSVTDNLKYSVDKAATEVRKKMQEYVDTTLKAQIGENVAKVIGLDKIISNMK